MNTLDKPSMLERSSLVRAIRWLFSWRGVRRLLIILAWVATLVALFYAEENWRGRYAWNQYRRQVEARGEHLDFKALIPKPVPDQDNFAATPFVRSLFQRTPSGDFAKPFHDNFCQVNDLIRYPKGGDYRQHRHFLDLVAWERALAAVRSGETEMGGNRIEAQDRDLESRAKAAPAVLEALKPDEPIFAELMTASRRPDVRYPVDYNVEEPFAIQWPELAAVRGLCQRLQPKACAELALGRNEPAFQDVELSLYLADSIKHEPTLIAYLVRVACMHIATQPVWEGSTEHRWSEPQLEALQKRFLEYNFVADCRPALAADRACGLASIDFLRRTGRLSMQTDPPAGTMGAFLWEVSSKLCRLAPRGWFDWERLNYSRLFNQEFEGVTDSAAETVFPQQVKANSQRLDQALSASRFSLLLHHRVTAGLFLPALGRLYARAAAAQTIANQAALACALERYRLANGQFPDELEDLVPRFIARLPKDVIGGADYQYRPTKDGRFLLYSVGWDQRDDGGKAGKIQFDDKSGDWAWE